MQNPITLSYDSIPQQLYWRAAQAACKVDSEKPAWHFILSTIGWVALFFAIHFALRFEIIVRGGYALVVGMALMWIGFLVLGRIQRVKLNGILATEQMRRGPVTMTFSPEGCLFQSSFGETRLNWRAVDQIIDLGDATGLRSGLMVYPIPHSSLPDGLDPASFQKTLREWAEI